MNRKSTSLLVENDHPLNILFHSLSIIHIQDFADSISHPNSDEHGESLHYALKVTRYLTHILCMEPVLQIFDIFPAVVFMMSFFV